jgi:hypothetical protein
VTRKEFRKAYGIVRLALKTPAEVTPATTEMSRIANEGGSGALLKILKVWSNRIHMVSGGECYAVATPRVGFTRKDSIEVALKAVRYRRERRAMGLSTAWFDRAPIPA